LRGKIFTGQIEILQITEKHLQLHRNSLYKQRIHGETFAIRKNCEFFFLVLLYTVAVRPAGAQLNSINLKAVWL